MPISNCGSLWHELPVSTAGINGDIGNPAEYKYL
jgi:hypothetical protein